MRCVVWALPLLFAAAACSGSTPTSANNGNNARPPGGNAATVAIADYSYTPSALTIKAGTTVTWTNNGQAGHTVTSDGGGGFASGTLSGSMTDPYGGMTSGGTYAATFSTPGTYPYHCAIHGAALMSGTLSVTP
jgi:plastocyanin